MRTGTLPWHGYKPCRAGCGVFAPEGRCTDDGAEDGNDGTWPTSHEPRCGVKTVCGACGAAKNGVLSGAVGVALGVSPLGGDAAAAGAVADDATAVRAS